MFSRKYLQQWLLSCYVTVFTLGAVSGTVLEDVNLLFSFALNQNESDGRYTEGYSPDASSNEIYNIDGEPVATPALSASASSSETIGIPSSGDAFSAEEKSTVTITPSSVTMPSMIITATKVTLGHRMLEVDSSKEQKSDISADELARNESMAITGTSGGENDDALLKQQRNSRHNRLNEHGLIEGETTSRFMSGAGFQGTGADYYKDLEAEVGNTAYGDNYVEENDITEPIPAPMALINPNGEGSNPPLEEDFAEAFKKGPSNGKRRRFRGSRKNRNKMKKSHQQNTIPSAPASAPADTISSGSSPISQQTSDQDLLTTASSSQASAPKFKRIRTTTQPPPPAKYSTTENPTSTEAKSLHTSPSHEKGSPGPVVKNGPKPIILQSMYNSDASPVTQSPQIEKPSGNTEKISTYFFSTPAPSTRFRLRQKVKETPPISSTTTTTTTTTTTESPIESHTVDEDELWKKEFQDFHKTSYFSGPVGNTNFKIPAFIPMDLGLETDDGQEAVENSLSRPEIPLENKAYKIIRHGHDATSHTHREYEDYPPSSSTTPKYKKTKRPTTSREIYSYDIQARIPPNSETEKTIGSDYTYSHTEPSTSFRPTPGGSHYDRTKDRVIFYNDNPYSTHHGMSTTVTLGDFPDTTPGSSQTVGTHFAVSEGPTVSLPNDPYTNVYTRGQVYTENSNPHSMDTSFKNGPPDSSHIHSPNIVEHSSLATLHQHESLQHHHNPYAVFDPSQQRPGGNSIYGTVEEVPAHGDISYANHHRHHHHQQIHSPSGSISSYPSFGLEMAGSPSHPSSIPHLHEAHHLPPPAPSHYSPQHHAHDFEPSQYDINPPQISYESQFTPNHNNVHGSASEIGNNDASPQLHSPSSQEALHHHSVEQSVHSAEILSPSSSAPSPDHPSESTNPAGQEGLPIDHNDPHAVYQAQQQVEGEFPPHAHTMAVHPDYEPANPPLPHDHPFHNRFVPFPGQDLHGEVPVSVPEQENQQNQHPNSIESNGASSFYPGTVESVPAATGRPPFEPSPQIPVDKPPSAHGIEFTPIPDDVKENDLYQVYAAGKPDELPHHPALHEMHGHPGTLVVNPTSMENLNGLSIHSGEQSPPPGYIESSGPSPPSFYPSGSVQLSTDNSLGKDMGYNGPVTEIHPGVYNHPIPEGGPHGESYQHHEQNGKIPYDEMHNNVPNRFRFPGDELKHEFKPSQLDLDKLNEGGITIQEHYGANGNDGKKNEEGKKQNTAFSNTPYVLMFPQLVSEDQMRPSPPSMLSKEIPVIQASSLPDFTSGEKPPLGPGYQAVPVHPRDQMYQVLAKAHYDKTMEKYMESKKRPPSAIYTPYGILVPVGTNVEAAASSMPQNGFPRPRPPPRREKSLLGSLLGSGSSVPVRFQGPPNMANRFNKILEFEPALDLLAEKLAIKLMAAQNLFTDKPMIGGYPTLIENRPIATEKLDEGPIELMMSDRGPASSPPHRGPGGGPPIKPMMMGGKPPHLPPLDLKDYLKRVLKGQIHEIVDKAPVSLEEIRKPMSLPIKLINSFFRKGRHPPKPFFPLPHNGNMMMPSMSSLTPTPNTLSNGGNIVPMPMPNGPPPTIPIQIPNGGGRIFAHNGPGPGMMAMSESNMIPTIGNSNIFPPNNANGGMMSSASIPRPNKILPPPPQQPPPPPQGSSSNGPTTPTPPHNPSHYHSGIGHPFPPIFPQGSGGIFGSIKRLFNFGPPDQRHDVSSIPNFGGRNLFPGNSTHFPAFMDGPSPRGSSQSKLAQLPSSSSASLPPHPNMIQHQPALMLQPTVQRKSMQTLPSPPTLSPSPLIGIKVVNNNNNDSDIYSDRNSHPQDLDLKAQLKKRKKPLSITNNKKGIEEQNANKLQGNNRLKPSPPQPLPITQTPPPPLAPSSTTPKPKLLPNNVPINKGTPYAVSPNSSGGAKFSSSSNRNSNSKPKNTSGKGKPVSSSQSKGGSSSKGESSKTAAVNTKKTDTLKKRRGSLVVEHTENTSTSSSPPPPPSTSPSPPQQSNRPTKLDMFQTLLGSTRSVLNYFKSEARKTSPTVLKPRTAIAMQEKIIN